LVKF